MVDSIPLYMDNSLGNDNDTAKEYNFSLEYSYRTEINNPIDEVLENALTYRHNMEEEHKHEFVDGKCECGEIDPDYEEHEHKFVDGECECGEVDPDYEKPQEPSKGGSGCPMGTMFLLPLFGAFAILLIKKRR